MRKKDACSYFWFNFLKIIYGSKNLRLGISAVIECRIDHIGKSAEYKCIIESSNQPNFDPVHPPVKTSCTIRLTLESIFACPVISKRVELI